MALNIQCPTPYKKKQGDFIEMLPPHHYVCLIYGEEIGKDDKGKPIYHTHRLYVCDGAVWKGNDQPLSLAQIEAQYPWFWDEYRKITPELRREVKLALPDEIVK